MRRVLGVLQHRQNPSVVTYGRYFYISTPYRSFVFGGLLINIGLLISACTISWLNCGGLQSIRQLRRSVGSQPNVLDHVDCRLAHSQAERDAIGFASGLQVNQSKAQRRIICYVHKQNHDEYSTSRSLDSQSTASDPFHGRLTHSQSPKDAMSSRSGSQTTLVKSQRGVIHGIRRGSSSEEHRSSQSLGSQSTAFDPFHVRLPYPQSQKGSIGFRTGSQASQVERHNGDFELFRRFPKCSFQETEKRSWKQNCEITINVSTGRARRRGVKIWL